MSTERCCEKLPKQYVEAQQSICFVLVYRLSFVEPAITGLHSQQSLRQSQGQLWWVCFTFNVSFSTSLSGDNVIKIHVTFVTVTHSSDSSAWKVLCLLLTSGNVFIEACVNSPTCQMGSGVRKPEYEERHSRTSVSALQSGLITTHLSAQTTQQNLVQPRRLRCFVQNWWQDGHPKKGRVAYQHSYCTAAIMHMLVGSEKYFI